MRRARDDVADAQDPALLVSDRHRRNDAFAVCVSIVESWAGVKMDSRRKRPTAPSGAHSVFGPRGSTVSGRQTELCKFGPLDPVCLPYSFVKMSMAWDTFSRRSSQSAGGDNCAAGTTSVRTTRLL
jgi:hypothetical protein